MSEKSYYIVMDTGKQLVSDIIKTVNNLDSTGGLVDETNRLEEKYGSSVVILNWKRLRSSLLMKIRSKYVKES